MLSLPAQDILADPDVYNRKWTRAELEEALRDSKEWLGNDIGKSRVVPPPWTPMQVEGQTIHSWAKAFRYDNSILPVSMVSQDLELLGGRPSFRLKHEGQWLEFSDANVSIEKEYDGLVRVRSVSRSGPFTLELNVGYEFDGMGKVDLRLSADSPSTVEGLQLVLPLKGEQSALFHYMGSRSNVIEVDGVLIRGAALPPMSDSGSTPDKGIQLDNLRELVWFGNQDAGISWFADSMENWPIKDEKTIQVLGPLENGVRTFTVKFGDKPFTLSQPLELVFGLQATPMRPRAKNFRTRVGYESLTENRPFLLQWRWGDGYYYPFQESHPEEARKDVETERAEGREILTTTSTEYIGLYRFSKGKFGMIDNPGLMHREMAFLKDQWDQVRVFPGTVEEAEALRAEAKKRRQLLQLGGKTIEEVLKMERHTAPGEDWDGRMFKPQTYPERFCFASTFKDFYMWKLKTLVEDTGLRALYLDQQMYQCGNPDHGCGYVDYKGEWASQANIFAIREFAKRMYMTFYEVNGTAPELMWHSSYQMLLPAMSFTTIFWDGEKYTQPGHPRSIVGQEFYSSFLDEGLMQVQHMGKPFGFIADFLPQMTRDELRGLTPTSPSPASDRDMMGLLMIHDSHIDAYRPLTYYPYLNARILNTRLSYPLDEMDVLYYWEKDRGLATAPESIKSIFHYNGEQALLILFNWGDETLLAQADIDAGELGLNVKNLQVKDALTGETLPVDGLTITADVLPRDFRMLEIVW